MRLNQCSLLVLSLLFFFGFHQLGFASHDHLTEETKTPSVSSLSLSDQEDKGVKITSVANSDTEIKDEETLFQLTQKANQGDKDAQHKLAIRLIQQSDSDTELKEGLLWLRKAAEQGNTEAQFDLGAALLNGMAGEPDEREAMEWFHRAAEGGYVDAQFNLGIGYMYGKGLYPDAKKAVYWYQKAAEQGHMESQNNLGDALKKGIGIKKNVTEAMVWIRKAAEQGSLISQLNLAEALINGNGVEQDVKEAHVWYRKAAESEDPMGQYMLGYVFEQGLTGEQNLEEAAAWYLKAAKQEDNLAQFRLAKLLWQGIKGKKQPQQAVYWYYKAGKNSNGDAMLRLGAILANTNHPRLTLSHAASEETFDDFLNGEQKANRETLVSLLSSLAGTYGERAVRYKYGSSKHTPNDEKAAYYQELFDLYTLHTGVLLQSLEMPLVFLPYKPQPSKGLLTLFGPDAPCDETITIFHLYPTLVENSKHPYDFAFGKKANMLQRKILGLFSANQSPSFETALQNAKERYNRWQTRITEAKDLDQQKATSSSSEAFQQKFAFKAKLIAQMEDIIHLYKTLLRETLPYRVNVFLNIYPYEQLVAND